MTHPTPELLPLLEDERVFYIAKNPNGNFLITEGCDDYFSKELTPEQLYALGEEIIALSGATRAQPKQLDEQVIADIIFNNVYRWAGLMGQAKSDCKDAAKAILAAQAKGE